MMTPQQGLDALDKSASRDSVQAIVDAINDAKRAHSRGSLIIACVEVLGRIIAAPANPDERATINATVHAALDRCTAAHLRKRQRARNEP